MGDERIPISRHLAHAPFARLKDFSELHCFDLDSTLAQCNVSVAFYQYLRAQGGVPRNILAPAVWSYFRMAILRESLKKIHEDLFFSGLKGLSFEFLERAAAEFINKFLFSILYIPVYTLFRRYQHLGHYVAILSSSPSFLVKEVSQRLEAHTFLGTEYSLDEKGSLLLIDSFMDGTEKGAVIEALRKKRSLETSSSFKITSYSDSYEDLSFLLAADEAIAIRPDSRLKHVAKAKKWQIL